MISCDIVFVGLVYACFMKYIHACSSTHNADSGVFTSPNYPANYPLSTQCTYTVAPSSLQAKLRLVFENFSTEENYDGVKIYDESDNLVTTISGGRYLWIVIPTMSSFRVVFISDNTRNNYIGFTASWSVSPSSASLEYKIAMAVGCDIRGLYKPLATSVTQIRHLEILAVSTFHDCMLLCQTLTGCLYFKFSNGFCDVFEEKLDYMFAFGDLLQKISGA